jgi:predicted nuclease with TOPRIM domain
MPNHSIHTNDTFLKDLDEKISKLSPIVDELDILSHQFKKLSRTANQIDTLVMSLRSRYEELKEVRDQKKE